MIDLCMSLTSHQILIDHKNESRHNGYHCHLRSIADQKINMKEHMIKQSQSEKEDRLGKRMILTLIPAISPFIVILLMYVEDPDSTLLRAVATWGSELPAVISAKNPLMSKVMDIYTKTAVLVAIIFALTSSKIMTINKEHPNTKIIGALFAYYLLYICLFYPILFCNQELTTSGRHLRLMSENDILLTFCFSTFYAGVFAFTVLLFWFTIGVCKLVKERR